MNETIKEIGIVKHIMKVARHLPRKNITTRITKMKANITASLSEEIESRIDSEPSIMTSILTSEGSEA